MDQIYGYYGYILRVKNREINSNIYTNYLKTFKFGTLHFKGSLNNIFLTLTCTKIKNKKIKNIKKEEEYRRQVIFKVSAGLCKLLGPKKATAYTKELVFKRMLLKAISLNYKILDLQFSYRLRYWLVKKLTYIIRKTRQIQKKKFFINLIIYKIAKIHGYLRRRKPRRV